MEMEGGRFDGWGEGNIAFFSSFSRVQERSHGGGFSMIYEQCW